MSTDDEMRAGYYGLPDVAQLAAMSDLALMEKLAEQSSGTLLHMAYSDERNRRMRAEETLQHANQNIASNAKNHGEKSNDADQKGFKPHFVAIFRGVATGIIMLVIGSILVTLGCHPK